MEFQLSDLTDFELVTLEHLENQGYRCTSESPPTECAYSDGKGGHCAIGFHIPEGHPASGFRGCVYRLTRQHPDLEGVVVPEGLAVSEFLQDFHDHHWEPGHADSAAEQYIRRRHYLES